MSKRDYYEVLGVKRKADDREISRAHRKLAIQYHPDSNPGDDQAVELFKEAAEAYEVLSDPEKRSLYNQFGHAGLGQSSGGGEGFSDVEDIFDAFGDIFGGAFGDMFSGGGRGKRRQQVRKGSRIDVEVTLDLEEAAKGITKTIQFDRAAKCSECNGSGCSPGSKTQQCNRCNGRGQVVQSAGILRVQTTCQQCGGQGELITEPCKSCQGQCFVAQPVTLEVTIPAGVDHGTRVRLAGEGQPSPDGGPAGDCFCFIAMKEHPLFQRQGPNLHCRVPISFTQAALGAKIEVPTLDGPDLVELPSGTQSGETFRLAQKGMPDFRTGGVGDLMITVYVEVPKTLSAVQEEMLRALAAEEDSNVTPHRLSFLEKVKDYIAPDKSEKSPTG